MRRGTIVSLALLGFLGAAGGAAAAGKQALGLHPRAGTTYVRSVTFSQNIYLGAVGQQLLLSRSGSLGLSFRVVGKNAAGETVVEGTYTSLSFAQNDLTGSQSWNSERPTQPPPAAIRKLAPLVGQSFRVAIAADGSIASIEGVEPQAIASIMSFFPAEPVGEGDSWRSGIDLTSNGAVWLDTRFTLRRRGGGTVVLDVAGAIRQKAGTSAIDMGGLLLGNGISGTLTGPLELEEGTGVPVRAELSYTFTGQVEVGGAKKLPFSLAAPFSGEGVFRVDEP